jgi:signal transduction histidine kinase
VSNTTSKPGFLGPDVPSVSFRQRRDFSFERISPDVAAMTGVPAERWQREKDLFLQVVEDSVSVLRQVEAAAHTPDGVVHSFRLRNPLDERLCWIVECRRTVLDTTGSVVAYEGFWLDLTRMAHVEERLATAAWREALSPVTMGVVHDFNNALTGILSLSEFFHQQTNAQHPFHEGLALIKQNTHQAARLAHRLMRLHHDKPGRRECSDLNTLAADLVELLRRVIPKRIALTNQWATVPLPVEIDSVGFQQTMLFCALNASEAIADRGTVHVETSFHARPHAPVRFVGSMPAGPSACLSIADSGAGIRPDRLSRLFEPFFTTKPAGRGSGLGLYHARLFAEAQGGAISVESEEGKGSTFRLWFPRVSLE